MGGFRHLKGELPLNPSVTDSHSAFPDECTQWALLEGQTQVAL